MDRTTILCCITALLTGCGARNHIVVGSKNFTEQLILGEIIAQHIEGRLHQPVERKLDLGGTLLALADLVARTIASPRQLPVGAIMALVGAPLFMALLRGRGR